MLKEIKNGGWHYFVDDMDAFQGEYKSWHVNGALSSHRYYVDGKQHGEYKTWNKNGVLRGHRYYVNRVVVHDFIASPLTDIEKMLLVLKHGGLLLPRGEVC